MEPTKMEDNFTENLIFNVEKNEVLYNKRHKIYYNKLFKRKIWQNIAKELGKTVEECYGKWKQLRERFVKETRKYTSSGSGADCLQLDSPWPYTQNLLFLREFVIPRKRKTHRQVRQHQSPSTSSTSNDNCIELDDTITSTLVAIEEAALAIKNKVPHTLDVDESFCRLLIALLNEIPLEAKDEARIKLFLCVMDIKKQYMQP